MLVFHNLFSQIEKKQIQKLPSSILCSIIENKNFDRKDEDQLFELISEIMNKKTENEESSNLYEELDFKKLSPTKFNEFINNFDYNEMTNVIWRKLCECFYTNYDEILQNRKEELLFEFDGKQKNRLNGIFHHLTEKFGGNVADKEIVSITSSSIYADNCLPKHVVDYYNQNYHFCSKNEENQWIQFDFKDRKVRPNNYSIQTNLKINDCNPQNWVIEVSNSGKENEWIVVDSRQNVTNIQKSNQIDTFKIKKQISSNASYRFIRLRQTGKSTGNSNHLMLAAFEIFGALIE